MDARHEESSRQRHAETRGSQRTEETTLRPPATARNHAERYWLLQLGKCSSQAKCFVDFAPGKPDVLGKFSLDHRSGRSTLAALSRQCGESTRALGWNDAGRAVSPSAVLPRQRPRSCLLRIDLSGLGCGAPRHVAGTMIKAASSMVGSTQNFASPFWPCTWTCILGSSREKK